MALLKCIECGNDVSDRAERCPKCGCPINIILEELNKIHKCVECDNSYDSTLSCCPKCGCPKLIDSNNKTGTYDATPTFNVTPDSSTFNVFKRKCPKCSSDNIRIDVQFVERVIRGRREVRRKSPVTRAANKEGRKAMILMTGGLWALTPKKSEYNEIVKDKIVTDKVKIMVCQDCGYTKEI